LLRQHVEHASGRFACGNGLVARLEQVAQPGIPAGGQLAAQQRSKRGGLFGMLLLVGLQLLLPRLLGLLAARPCLLHVSHHVVRRVERRLNRPAQRQLGGAQLVVA